MIRFKNLRSRVICLMLSAASVFLLAVPALAAPHHVESQEPSYSSRVHSRPSYGSSHIGQLEDGTKIAVLSETEEFYRIDCHEMNGYIAKDQVSLKDGEYYVNCNADSEEAVPMEYVPMTDALLLRSSILELLRHQLGKPYCYGSTGPYGFDCSGLTSYILREHHISVSRCADSQMGDGLIVPRDSLQVGDLVFFRDHGSPWLASHVGIYAGSGQFIHASTSRGVRYDSLDYGYFASRYVGARRVVNVSTAGIEQAPAAGMCLTPAARSISGIRTAQ